MTRIVVYDEMDGVGVNPYDSVNAHLEVSMDTNPQMRAENVFDELSAMINTETPGVSINFHNSSLPVGRIKTGHVAVEAKIVCGPHRQEGVMTIEVSTHPNGRVYKIYGKIHLEPSFARAAWRAGRRKEIRDSYPYGVTSTSSPIYGSPYVSSPGYGAARVSI